MSTFLSCCLWWFIFGILMGVLLSWLLDHLFGSHRHSVQSSASPSAIKREPDPISGTTTLHAKTSATILPEVNASTSAPIATPTAHHLNTDIGTLGVGTIAAAATAKTIAGAVAKTHSPAPTPTVAPVPFSIESPAPISVPPLNQGPAPVPPVQSPVPAPAAKPPATVATWHTPSPPIAVKPPVTATPVAPAPSLIPTLTTPSVQAGEVKAQATSQALIAAQTTITAVRETNLPATPASVTTPAPMVSSVAPALSIPVMPAMAVEALAPAMGAVAAVAAVAPGLTPTTLPPAPITRSVVVPAPTAKVSMAVEPNIPAKAHVAPTVNTTLTLSPTVSVQSLQQSPVANATIAPMQVETVHTPIAAPAMFVYEKPWQIEAAKHGFIFKPHEEIELVDGIGPKIGEYLRSKGVNTFEKIAKTNLIALNALMKRGGPRFKHVNPITWAEQAKLAAAGRWAELRHMQDGLIDGVPSAKAVPKGLAPHQPMSVDSPTESFAATLGHSTPINPGVTQDLASWQASALAAGFVVRGHDDLQLVEGIGPKIDALMKQSGITTFAALAQTDEVVLKNILHRGGDHFRLAQPRTWPEQARLASLGHWTELKILQDKLTAGVDKTQPSSSNL